MINSLFQIFDPGYYFDVLAIYNAKIELCNREHREKNIKNFENLAALLKQEIGEGKFNAILGSDYYESLFEVNKKIFLMVDLAKEDKVKASEVDAENYNRFLIKTSLQIEFFPEEGIKEIKVGYLKE